MLFSPYVKKVDRIFCYFAGREGNPMIPSMDAVASQLILQRITRIVQTFSFPRLKKGRQEKISGMEKLLVGKEEQRFFNDVDAGGG